MIRQYELVERVRAYDPNADEALLNRAYVVSMKAHGAQTRYSGDPYFSHPLEVAGILTELRLDTATIVTALLHDTLEDTVATYEEIEEQFGSEIATLVDGVTKLSKIEFSSDSEKQAENFRKLLVAMSNDIRVLLVKLGDRLHNMRTLYYVPDPDKRRRIALETMEIYAPLAERIGMQEIKDELEDLAFKELNPEARDSVVKRLEFLRRDGGLVVDRIARAIEDRLGESGINAAVLGREKRPYSIWRKMERKHVTFEQLSDIIAFRVVVEDIPACYRVLGIIHGAWPMVPGRFKDYISTPKRNDYRSIHTTVIGPELRRVELQIRTQDMEGVAEYGVAAHWSYKQGADRPSDVTAYRWLRELLEIHDNASSPEEFLEHTKLEMFQDQVFCFTPKGDLIALPQEATVVDFAYAVHTEIGNACVGAKVNGRAVPLRTRLQNGDQVEIIRSAAQAPSPNWESFVVTGRARSAIRRYIRQQQRKEFASLGVSIVEESFRRQKKPMDDALVRDAARSLDFDAPDDLYVAVGQGNVTGRAVVEAALPGESIKGEPMRIVLFDSKRRRRRRAEGPGVPIRGLIPGMAVHYGPCCHPLPGDRIVGIVDPGRGVDIHTIDCEALEAFTNMPERWLDVSWDREVEDAGTHVGRITTVVTNEPGTLSALSSVIAQNHGNISNLRITDRGREFFEMTVDIEVHDVKHLVSIITALRASPAVSSVERARG